LAPIDGDRWIKEDLTVEIKGTFTIPLSSKTINNGPPASLVACLLSLLKSYHPGEVFSIYSERLIMSSSSSSTSTSSPSSSGLSLTETLSVEALQALSP